MEGPDGDRWKESTAKELNGLSEKGMLREEMPPQGAVRVNTSFIFVIKRALDRSVERYNSSKVEKGYTQRFGVEYFEFFSPVVSLYTMRTIIAMSTSRGIGRGRTRLQASILQYTAGAGTVVGAAKLRCDAGMQSGVRTPSKCDEMVEGTE